METMNSMYCKTHGALRLDSRGQIALDANISD
jgi:hypothetical protein